MNVGVVHVSRMTDYLFYQRVILALTYCGGVQLAFVFRDDKHNDNHHGHSFPELDRGLVFLASRLLDPRISVCSGYLLELSLRQQWFASGSTSLQETQVHNTA